MLSPYGGGVYLQSLGGKAVIEFQSIYFSDMRQILFPSERDFPIVDDFGFLVLRGFCLMRDS